MRRKAKIPVVQIPCRSSTLRSTITITGSRSTSHATLNFFYSVLSTKKRKPACSTYVVYADPLLLPILRFPECPAFSLSFLFPFQQYPSTSAGFRRSPVLVRHLLVVRPLTGPPSRLKLSIHSSNRYVSPTYRHCIPALCDRRSCAS